MKKKVIIFIITCFILIIGIVGFIVWNNRTVSTITLDINPSIQIDLTNKERIKKIIALNKDAKDIINEDLKGKSLDDTLKIITDNVIDKGYAEDGQVVILLYSSGNIDNQEIKNRVNENFTQKDIRVDLIVIDNVTKEDKKLAKKYNISPAKASYINSILKDNENIKTGDLIDKPIRELNETKMRGTYCENGYFLEGDFCLKEIERKQADNGMVCKEGYYEYNGKCYEEVRSEEGDKLICRDDFTLNGTECSRTIKIDAEPTKYSCQKGDAKTMLELGLTDSNAGNANNIVCVDYSNATHPVTPCELPASDPTERMSSGGRCYWHRAPVIAEGCPGKIQVAGECWDDATNVYICAGYRDGKQYSSKSEYCEHSIKYIDPVVTEYKCPDDYKLNGSKCEKEEKEDAWHERVCPSGYSLVHNDRCINYNKITSKESGFVCNQENSKLKGNICIIYEIIEAKHN